METTYSRWDAFILGLIVGCYLTLILGVFLL